MTAALLLLPQREMIDRPIVDLQRLVEDSSPIMMYDHFHVPEPQLLLPSINKANKTMRQKKVSFAQRYQVIHIPSPLDQLADLGIRPSILWYGADEMWLFREQARLVCQQMRDSTVNAGKEGSTSEKSPDKVCTMALDGETRGLEYRICHERQRRKVLATRCVAKAQAKLDSERLAALAQRCNQWAANLARQEGARDYTFMSGTDFESFEGTAKSIGVEKSCYAFKVLRLKDLSS
ncbi:hypothetical protein ACA910_006813 [Epithemia clementina (nom. ined.)]